MTSRRHVAIALLLVVASIGGLRAASSQAGDFNFRFEERHCSTERLDTFSGDFTRDRGVWPPTVDQVKLSLSDEQMSAIYRVIENITRFRGLIQTDRQRLKAIACVTSSR